MKFLYVYIIIPWINNFNNKSVNLSSQNNLNIKGLSTIVDPSIKYENHKMLVIIASIIQLVNIISGIQRHNLLFFTQKLTINQTTLSFESQLLRLIDKCYIFISYIIFVVINIRIYLFIRLVLQIYNVDPGFFIIFIYDLIKILFSSLLLIISPKIKRIDEWNVFIKYRINSYGDFIIFFIILLYETRNRKDFFKTSINKWFYMYCYWQVICLSVILVLNIIFFLNKPYIINVNMFNN